jgi:uncharacterized membrane protein
MPAMTAAFASMRPDQLSDATPQINVLMRLGSAIGVAVLAVVLQRASGGATTHPAHAFDTAYWWGLGIAVLSLIPCIMLLRAERARAGVAAAAETAAAAGEAAAVEPIGV